MPQPGAEGARFRVSAIKLHLDEDADAHALLQALRQRGQDVTSSREQGILSCTDEEQLDWATEQGRVIYTYNAGDFCHLHSDYLRRERHHAGIVIGDQQTLSVGHTVRRVLKLGEVKTAEDMKDHLEFLSNWT